MLSPAKLQPLDNGSNRILDLAPDSDSGDLRPFQAYSASVPQDSSRRFSFNNAQAEILDVVKPLASYKTSRAVAATSPVEQLGDDERLAASPKRQRFSYEMEGNDEGAFSTGPIGALSSKGTDPIKLANSGSVATRPTKVTETDAQQHQELVDESYFASSPVRSNTIAVPSEQGNSARVRAGTNRIEGDLADNDQARPPLNDQHQELVDESYFAASPVSPMSKLSSVAPTGPSQTRSNLVGAEKTLAFPRDSDAVTGSDAQIEHQELVDESYFATSPVSSIAASPGPIEHQDLAQTVSGSGQMDIPLIARVQATVGENTADTGGVSRRASIDSGYSTSHEEGGMEPQ
jgi:hypothetical protein